MHSKVFVPDINKIILKGQERKDLIELITADPTVTYGYNFTFDSQKGLIDAVHDDDYIYDLPFETHKEYKMIQGYGGKFSHRGEDNYYSYDFRMPSGSSVTAARDGIVIEVQESFRVGGRAKKLRDKANYIYIEHEDNTIAVYSHLLNNGSLVKVGDFVQKGQKIALSGNTGYSDSPHLHFSVAKFLKGELLQSIPIKISTSEGSSTKLEKYKSYKKP